MKQIDLTADDAEAADVNAGRPPTSPIRESVQKIKRLLTHRWLVLALRLSIGGIFLYAGVTKVINPQAFADSIATFKMLPPTLINLVAIALPPFEVLLGGMLLSGWRLRAGLLGALLLTLVFVIALGQGIARGLPIDCGCFGSGKPSVLSAWFSFARALLLAAASAWAFLLAVRQTRENGADSGTSS